MGVMVSHKKKRQEAQREPCETQAVRYVSGTRLLNIETLKQVATLFQPNKLKQNVVGCCCPPKLLGRTWPGGRKFGVNRRALRGAGIAFPALPLPAS